MDQTSSLTEKTLPAKPLAGLFVVLFVATIIGGWLYVDSVRNELEMRISTLEARRVAQPVENAETPTFATRPVFDTSTVKVGDRVGAWTVVKIEGTEPGYPRKVTLSGSATIMGTYKYWPEDELIVGGVVFFNSAQDTATPLPSASSKPGVYSFGFSNFAKAQSIFGPEGSTGSATIKISDFTVNLIEGETWDTVESFDIVKDLSN